MARLNFNSIFITHDDGFLEPRQRIRVGGVVLGPGTKFKNTSFGGIDFSQFIGHDFEVETDRDILVIKKIYPRD